MAQVDFDPTYLPIVIEARSDGLDQFAESVPLNINAVGAIKRFGESVMLNAATPRLISFEGPDEEGIEQLSPTLEYIENSGAIRPLDLFPSLRRSIARRGEVYGLAITETTSGKGVVVVFSPYKDGEVRIQSERLIRHNPDKRKPSKPSTLLRRELLKHSHIS